MIQLDPDFAIAKYFLGYNTGACLDWTKAGELGDLDPFTSLEKNVSRAFY